MKNVFARFINDESGATAIEYGLIAALIAVVLITALTSVGTKGTALFNGIATELESATPGGGTGGGGETGGTGGTDD